MNTYLQYNDPIRIQFRSGNVGDEYVSLTETQKILNNVIILQEIPDDFNHVVIAGYTEIYDGVPTPSEFIVNYANGMVTFHPSQEGKTVSAKYLGRGFVLYPAERIYAHNKNPNITTTLQAMIDSGESAIDALAKLQPVIDAATSATENAKTQAGYAKTQGDNAKTQGDYSKTQGDYAKNAGDSLVYKGVYNSSNAYVVRNIVYYNGSTYMCVANTTNNAPTNTTYWKRMGGLLWRSTYSASTTYSFGDFVSDASGNVLYMAIIDSSLNKPLTDITAWTKMVSVQGAIDNATAATTSANNAANAANTAKTNADVATAAANVATTAANKAKVDADTATAGANKAKTDADASAVNADGKALYAQQQGDYAKSTGDSLVHKGTYNPATAYVIRNLVYYNGATYMCTANATGIVPTNASNWQKVTNMLWKGTYSSTTTYNFGDVVTDNLNQNVYICILDGTLNKALSTTANWTPLMSVTASVTSANNAATAANNAATAANTAKTNADKATADANTAKTYAEQQGDYAKLEGDYAKSQADAAAASKALADIATANANTATTAANKAKNDADKATADANTARDSANTAATTANTAASNANDKATLAVTATTNANKATADANTAKTNADKATVDAMMATSDARAATMEAQVAKDGAEDATANANVATTQANTARDAAIAAAALANTAKTNADSATASADEATQAANKATTDANEATAAANKAKSDADVATGKANTATTAANTARDSANAAATAATTAKDAANAAKTSADTATVNANIAKDAANTAAVNANAVASATTHRGTYNSATAYVPNNIVDYNGSSYMNIVASTGVVPTDVTKWKLVGSKGDQGIQGIQGIKGDSFAWKGIYDAGTTYDVRDVVQYNGTSFVNKVASTGKIPTDTGYWEIFASKGVDGTGAVVTLASENGDVVIAGTVQVPDLSISTSLKSLWSDKYTKAEVDSKISQATANIQWKASVNTYADIATTYTNPQDGWTVNVNDTDYTYRYTGTQWIAISANSIPNASSNADGKMSIADFIKLQGISTGANKTELSANNGKIKIDGADITVYTHPIGAGNNHIPSGGATGNYLKYNASGVAVWATPNWTDIVGKPTTLSGYGITDAVLVKSDIINTIAAASGVSDKPASANLVAITYDGLSGLMDGRYTASKANNASTADNAKDSDTVDGKHFTDIQEDAQNKSNTAESNAKAYVDSNIQLLSAELSSDLENKQDKDQKGVAGGYAPLDSDGVVPKENLATGNYVVNYIEQMNSLTKVKAGDICTVLDADGIGYELPHVTYLKSPTISDSNSTLAAGDHRYIIVAYNDRGKTGTYYYYLRTILAGQSVQLKYQLSLDLLGLTDIDVSKIEFYRSDPNETDFKLIFSGIPDSTIVIDDLGVPGHPELSYRKQYTYIDNGSYVTPEKYVPLSIKDTPNQTQVKRRITQYVSYGEKWKLIDALGFTPENAANKGVPYGYASLDKDGKVVAEQLSNIKGSGGEPAKVFNRQYTMVSDQSMPLNNKYRYNNSMKAVVTGITIFIPDTDIINDGNDIKLDKLKDVLDVGDNFTLSWFDNTPLGRTVKRVEIDANSTGLISFTDFTYEIGLEYCSVYVDGIRFFEGESEFAFREIDSKSISLNGDFTGSKVKVEVLTN